MGRLMEAILGDDRADPHRLEQDIEPRVAHGLAFQVPKFGTTVRITEGYDRRRVLSSKAGQVWVAWDQSTGL
jgi:hypothetical protein